MPNTPSEVNRLMDSPGTRDLFTLIHLSLRTRAKVEPFLLTENPDNKSVWLLQVPYVSGNIKPYQKKTKHKREIHLYDVESNLQ